MRLIRRTLEEEERAQHAHTPGLRSTELYTRRFCQQFCEDGYEGGSRQGLGLIDASSRQLLGAHRSSKSGVGGAQPQSISPGELGGLCVRGAYPAIGR